MPPLRVPYSVVPYPSGCLPGLLPQPYQHHPHYHNNHVEYQRAYHLPDTGETLCLRAGRHDDIYRSANAGNQQKVADYAGKYLHNIFSVIILPLFDRVNEHPQCQQRRNPV